jgi:hypothetical protein
MKKFIIGIGASVFVLLVLCIVVAKTTKDLKRIVNEQEAQVIRIEKSVVEECPRVQRENVRVLEGLKITLNKASAMRPEDRNQFLSKIKTIKSGVEKCDGSYECAMANSCKTLILVGKYLQLSKK